MFISIANQEIYFERFDADSTHTTLILHGWGAHCDTMRGIFNALKNQNKSVIMLDFPYFGKSAPPPEHADIFFYADLVEKFLEAQNISSVNILGHSFGGRVAMILAGSATTAHRVHKLILMDAAGLKPRRGLKYFFKVRVYKLKKRLNIKPKKPQGSSDYAALPDSMKSVFIRVVNTHLKHFAKNIKAETLLVWGKNDKDTPMYMAKKLNRFISNSALIALDNAAHYVFLDKPMQVHAIINAFF